MAPGPNPLAAASLLTLVLLQACAAPAPALPRAVAVEAGQRTRVALVDTAADRVFAVQNASSGTRKDVYSDPAAQAWTKVLPDDGVQNLLDVLAAKGMFERASRQAPPNARDVLVVESGGEAWYWARTLRGMQQQELSFHEAKAYFLTAWNQATAYRSATVDKSDFEAARTRAQQSGDAAKQRLQNLGGPPK